MKSRLDAIIAHWASLATYYGGSNAKRYRTNLKRAATAARETASLFDNFQGAGRQLVASDVETLRKAATLLSQLADDFEVAQRKADKSKADAEAAAKAKHQEEVRRVILELFGEMPSSQEQPAEGDHPVIAMAKDLVYFDQTGVEELAKGKWCDRGLLTNSWDISNLDWHSRHAHVEDCARIIAENRISTSYPGRSHIDSRGKRWYHAGWDDFIDWRKIRQQVRATFQVTGDES